MTKKKATKVSRASVETTIEVTAGGCYVYSEGLTTPLTCPRCKTPVPNGQHHACGDQAVGKFGELLAKAFAK